MAEITNFPLYSQKENRITNYTLFLFRRLYRYDLNKFELFINSLVESDTNIVPRIYFGQQESTDESRVDGVINQKSFKILIETKRGKSFGLKQIRKHLTGFEDEEQKILLLVSAEDLNEDTLKNIREETVTNYNQNIDDGESIELYNTSFNNIINIFREVIEEYDAEMHELIDDYEVFCEKQKVLDKKSTRMRYVPCGSTYELNLKYGLYYMPVDRGYKSHDYLGIYKNKCIRAVGKIKKISVIDCDKEKGKIKVKEGDSLTEEEKSMLLDVVDEAFDKYGHAVHKNSRFFLVEKFYKTEFKKTSKYGVPGARYHDLSEFLGEELPEDTAVIAERLNEYEF